MDMKKYLAVFMAPLAAYDAMKEKMKAQTPEDRQKSMEEWQRWMTAHKANLVDPGAGVGGATRVAQGGATSSARNEIGGYMIVQANSAEEAAALFVDMPHFGIEGGWIDVMECMQM